MSIPSSTVIVNYNNGVPIQGNQCHIAIPSGPSPLKSQPGQTGALPGLKFKNPWSFLAGRHMSVGEPHHDAAERPFNTGRDVPIYSAVEMLGVYDEMVRLHGALGETILLFGQMVKANTEGHQRQQYGCKDEPSGITAVQTNTRTATSRRVGPRNSTPTSDSGYSSNQKDTENDVEDVVLFSGHLQDTVVFRGRAHKGVDTGSDDESDVVLFHGRPPNPELGYKNCVYLTGGVSLDPQLNFSAPAEEDRLQEDATEGVSISNQSSLYKSESKEQITASELLGSFSICPNSTETASTLVSHPTQSPDTPNTIICADFKDEDPIAPIAVCPKSIALDNSHHRRGLDLEHRDGPSFFNSEAVNHDVSEQMYQLYIINGLVAKPEWSIGMGAYLEDVSASLIGDCQQGDSAYESALVIEQEMAEYKAVREHAVVVDGYDEKAKEAFVLQLNDYLLTTPLPEQLSFNFESWLAASDNTEFQARQVSPQAVFAPKNTINAPEAPEPRLPSLKKESALPVTQIRHGCGSTPSHKATYQWGLTGDYGGNGRSCLEKGYIGQDGILEMADGTLQRPTMAGGVVFGFPVARFRHWLPEIPADAFLKPLSEQNLPWLQARLERQYMLEAGIGSPVVEMLVRRIDRKRAIRAAKEATRI